MRAADRRFARNQFVDLRDQRIIRFRQRLMCLGTNEPGKDFGIAHRVAQIGSWDFASTRRQSTAQHASTQPS
jgi:hypothetical protein